MSAPFFCTIPILKSDLRTLGYPEIDDESDSSMFASDGPARLRLLSWLASTVDPTADISSTDAVATFWDSIGVHCAERPNAMGHRIPFTTTDRPRDRAAALVFLRTAIDLALATRRLRNGNEIPLWIMDENQQNNENYDDGCIEVDDFDIMCLNQMDMFIKKRHTFFPSATLVPPQKIIPKRTPLIKRSSPTNANNVLNNSNSFNNQLNMNANASSKKPQTGASKPPRLVSSSSFHKKTMNSGELSRTSSFSGSTSTRTVKQSRPKPGSTKTTTLTKSKSRAQLTRSKSMKPTSTSTSTLSSSSSLLSSSSNSTTTATSRKPPLKGKRSAAATAASHQSETTITRDSILCKLRALRRETTDLTNEIVKKEEEYNDSETEKETETETEDNDEFAIVQELTEEATVVAKLMSKFDALVDEARTVRAVKGRRAQRDVEMEQAIATLMPQCKQLEEDVQSTVENASRVKQAAQTLQKGAEVIEKLPRCRAVRGAVRLQHRTERHL